MENKTSSSEMSLDEVLSSIKKMVIDEEPPVLELTNMVSDDGTIVNVKKTENTSNGTDNVNHTNAAHNNKNDMSTFLKLIQDDLPSEIQPKKDEKSISASDNDQDRNNDNEEKTVSSINNDVAPNISSDNMMHKLIREALNPLLKKWLDEKLPTIVNKIVEEEVRNFLFSKHGISKKS